MVGIMRSTTRLTVSRHAAARRKIGAAKRKWWAERRKAKQS
jgi:hypothetical protein